MLFRICAVLCNFYPRPPRGGRPVCFAAGRVSVSISIHALREEGDSSPIFKKVAILNFYPRPPRGGRRGVCAGIVAPELISIHALREEGDCFWPAYTAPVRRFLSTPSARRATKGYAKRRPGSIISIHALREEGDPPLPPLAKPPTNFYPRPPRGGRHHADVPTVKLHKFLSTPSARRATSEIILQERLQHISIHALREEGDARRSVLTWKDMDFYPRPPRGGRPGSTEPRAGREADFYPRPPRGGRHRPDAARQHRARFLSTPSARRATSRRRGL